VSGERIVEANGVPLCVETFGDPADPAILLIAGAAMSMDWWDDAFCARLAAGPRYVIRYDHRDTGRSVSYEAGAPPYSGADLTDDAAGVVLALGLTRAHVVGVSMGGGIAQELALLHPDLVASLTLMSTSPVAKTSRELPPPSDELRALFANPPPEPDWSDRTAAIEYLVEGERPYAGAFFDEGRSRELAARVVDRTVDIAASVANHWLVSDEKPSPPLDRITAPTLVIHGTADPVFPPAHGEALAEEISGARLLLVEGMGHEVPPPAFWDVVVPAILEQSAET
jgi:pimeloyl-ACP methyl ester carboxylesterase